MCLHAPARAACRSGSTPGCRRAPAAFASASATVKYAAKHSGATSVRVDVSRRDDLLSVRVADDGIGGADPDGEGITGLRRRVEAHDGHLSVDSTPGRGTILTAELPCGS